MRPRLSILAVLLASVASSLLGGGAARAQGMSAQCTVTEFHATNDKKGVDPKLDKLKGLLATPPFKSWDSFTLLSESSVTIERQKPQPVKLDRGTLTLLYKDKLIEEGGKARVRVAVDFDESNGKRVLSTVLVFGSPTSLGGTPYKGGNHFIYLGCSAQ
jgi:hypothetical protein